jgi:formylmethanofuran dehydrogenase subunit E-like metal-binding protein
MERKTSLINIFQMTFIIAAIFISAGICCGAETDTLDQAAQEYNKWKAMGKSAADQSFAAMKKAGAKPQKGDTIVLTNAGYAEVNGASTQGALDGLTEKTGASRGANTLVEIHSSPWTKLWFAVYDKASGLCAYLEVNPSAAGESTNDKISGLKSVFDIQALERVNFDYLNTHADEFKVKFDQKVFGGNEFRVIGILNAISQGVPSYAVRAFEFHDHYCPGVTSGIMMATYLKRHFPPASGSDYFVQAIQPWCKEDALMVLLNATPGKGGYGVSYPSNSDKERLLPEAKNASTVVYRKTSDGKRWEGVVLAFKWAAETQCPETGNGVVDKVCSDLWYLKRMGNPEEFVSVVKSIELPEGVSPKDWAAPGVNVMEKLGLVHE